MSLAVQPLDEEERAELDAFLLFRGSSTPDDTFVEGNNEGILTLSELDGFFTAIVSGPVNIDTSRWLPAVWGDVPPQWTSKQFCEHILALLARHMNTIATSLRSEQQVYQPLFLEQEVAGKAHTIVHEWCKGYMRGIELAPEQWQCGGDEMLSLLMTIDIFTNQWGWRILERLNQEENATLKREIGPAARAIYSYWLGRRGRAVSSRVSL